VLSAAFFAPAALAVAVEVGLPFAAIGALELPNAFGTSPSRSA
jgi:hypothetical protein